MAAGESDMTCVSVPLVSWLSRTISKILSKYESKVPFRDFNVLLQKNKSSEVVLVSIQNTHWDSTTPPESYSHLCLTDSPPMPVPAQSSDEKPRELFKIRAYEELKSRFFNYQYPPGTVLSERQLAEELGMSKTPVKAALERLQLEGFITVSPQSGIIVRELKLDELHELYEIRVALEGFVLKSVAGKLTADQLSVIENNLQRYAAIEGTSQTAREAAALDAEFHQLPVQFLGNQLIFNTLQKFSVRIVQLINSTFMQLPSRIGQSLIEHREIVEAIRAGRGEQARELGERHLRVGHEILVAALEQKSERTS